MLKRRLGSESKQGAILELGTVYFETILFGLIITLRDGMSTELLFLVMPDSFYLILIRIEQ